MQFADDNINKKEDIKEIKNTILSYEEKEILFNQQLQQALKYVNNKITKADTNNEQKTCFKIVIKAIEELYKDYFNKICDTEESNFYDFNYDLCNKPYINESVLKLSKETGNIKKAIEILSKTFEDIFSKEIRKIAIHTIVNSEERRQVIDIDAEENGEISAELSFIAKINYYIINLSMVGIYINYIVNIEPTLKDENGVVKETTTTPPIYFLTMPIYKEYNFTEKQEEQLIKDFKKKNTKYDKEINIEEIEQQLRLTPLTEMTYTQKNKNQVINSLYKGEMSQTYIDQCNKAIEEGIEDIIKMPSLTLTKGKNSIITKWYDKERNLKPFSKDEEKATDYAITTWDRFLKENRPPIIDIDQFYRFYNGLYNNERVTNADDIKNIYSLFEGLLCKAWVDYSKLIDDQNEHIKKENKKKNKHMLVTRSWIDFEYAMIPQPSGKMKKCILLKQAPLQYIVQNDIGQITTIPKWIYALTNLTEDNNKLLDVCIDKYTSLNEYTNFKTNLIHKYSYDALKCSYQDFKIFSNCFKTFQWYGNKKEFNYMQWGLKDYDTYGFLFEITIEELFKQAYIDFNKIDSKHRNREKIRIYSNLIIILEGFKQGITTNDGKEQKPLISDYELLDKNGKQIIIKTSTDKKGLPCINKIDIDTIKQIYKINFIQDCIR